MSEDITDLSMELLETLYVIAKRFFEYADKYNVTVDGLDSLSLLMGRAEIIMKELGSPLELRSNPIRRKFTDDDSRRRLDRALG